MSARECIKLWIHRRVSRLLAKRMNWRINNCMNASMNSSINPRMNWLMNKRNQRQQTSMTKPVHLRINWQIHKPSRQEVNLNSLDQRVRVPFSLLKWPYDPMPYAHMVWIVWSCTHILYIVLGEGGRGQPSLQTNLAKFPFDAFVPSCYIILLMRIWHMPCAHIVICPCA